METRDRTELNFLTGNTGDSPYNVVDENSESFYLFVSFDLCNSTKFKTIHPASWPFVLNQFYTQILELMIDDESVDTFRTWKYVGDEVLFYKEVHQDDRLRNLISKIYKDLHSIIEKIQSACPEAIDILSVKSTAWCALVRPYQHDSEKSKEPGKPQLNFKLMNLKSDAQSPSQDFAGPDIDLGFRLGGHTFARRLLISGELAFIACNEVEHDSLNERFRIVGYEILKGIWTDRRYPIIWYEEKWGTPEIPYAYDDRFLCRHIESIQDKTPDPMDKKYLENIYRSVNRLNVIDELTKAKNSTPPDGKNERTRPRPLTENHFVAMCFSADGKQILCAKRNADKKIFPDRWEYGCGQPLYNEKVDICLKRAYKCDFDIDIDMATNDGNHIPVIAYDLEKESQLVFGLRFLAHVKSGQTPKAINHQDVKLMDVAVAQQLPKCDCVPGFHDALGRALKIIKNINS